MRLSLPQFLQYMRHFNIFGSTNPYTPCCTFERRSWTSQGLVPTGRNIYIFLRFFLSNGHALLLLMLVCAAGQLRAQKNLLEIDTTNGFGKNLLELYKKYDHIRFSGYLQPQFQVIDTAGAKTFGGGDFSPYSNNRFMLRRGRIRMDYAHLDKQGRPSAFFVFQFDGTERAFVARDFWGRFFENRWQLLAFSIGIMARPLGQELLYGSGDRETPERGRMSQLLTRTERDLGAMLTVEPRKADTRWGWFRWDLMLANGQGLTGPVEFDSHKDVVTRFTVKPRPLSHNMRISGGVFGLLGGLRQTSAVSFVMQGRNWLRIEQAENIGNIAKRRYAGADVQLRIPNRKGVTELRAEYMYGLQTGTARSSETPGTLPLETNGSFSALYTRPFDGAYFYWLQHLGSAHHQFILKYDWYDPNTAVRGREIGEGFTGADVRYDTWGLGYIYYVNAHLKIVNYYEWVRNEKTSLREASRDLKDNLFTCRLQYRF